MGNTYGQAVIIPKTNKSGGAVAAGDVVIIDTSNSDAFTTTTSSAYTGRIGIAQEAIASNAIGRILVAGHATLVNVSASVSIGDYGRTHTVAKQAVSVGSSRTQGTFCQFTTSGTTPAADIFAPDLGNSGSLTQAYAGYNGVGASTENMASRKVYMKKVTLANDCLLTNIEAYVDAGNANDSVDSLSAAIFADNSGTPRDLIAYTMNPDASLVLDNTGGAGGNTVARWVGLPMGKWLVAGDYWIAVALMDASAAAFRIYYDATVGSDRTYVAGGNWITDAGFTSVTTGTNKYSIRANTIR